MLRLRGLRRREVKKLVVSMGGFCAVVHMAEQGTCMLTFNDESAMPDQFSLERRTFASNGVRTSGRSVWFEIQHRGSFTQQAEQLVNLSAAILGLFPLVISEFNSETQYYYNGDWRNGAYLLTESMKLSDRVMKRFRMGARVPLCLARGEEIILLCRGDLIIFNDMIEVVFWNPIEERTGLPPTADEYDMAIAYLEFQDKIFDRMRQTIGDRPLVVAGTRSFAATGPIRGKEITRWILAAATSCGVTVSQCDLAEYDLLGEQSVEA